MKLESDQVLGVQAPPRKSYNPFDSDDELEAGNGYLKSSLNGYDIRSFETNDESLTFHLDSGDLSWEEAILGHSQVLSRTIPAESNGEEVLFRKDSELFSDKTVTDTELPDIMVYYKENGYDSVKDIGIDEGMPAHDKVSIKSRDKLESKNMPSLLGLNGHINDDKHLELPYMEGLKSRTDGNSESDVSSQNRPQDSLKESGSSNEDLQMQQVADHSKIDDSSKVNGLKHDPSEEQSTSSKESPTVFVESGSEVFGTGDPQLIKEDELNYPKLENKKNQVSKEEHDEDKIPMNKIHESSTIPTIAKGAKDSVDYNEDSSENGVGNALSYNSKVEPGSIILDFNSSTSEKKEEEEKEDEEKAKDEEKAEDRKEKEEKEKSEQNKTVAKPPEAQSMSRLGEGVSGSIFNSGSDNRVHGETSFSAAMPVPTSITYMGPHVHNGSISLRSESSAGSTRSFAFPVLQTEWNSSPVRMAKAEQRNFHKQRGWLHSVICCRF